MIAHQMGYRYLDIQRYDRKGESMDGLYGRIDGLTAAVRPGDLLVYQYPAYIGNQFEVSFGEHMYVRHVNFVPFVHDAEMVRFGVDPGFDEILYLNLTAANVVANSSLEKVLRDAGAHQPMILQHEWDYLTTQPLNTKPLERKVVLAGTFIKSDLLSTWQQETPLIAFGPNNDQIPAPNVDYRGQFDQTTLFDQLPNALGLAWDTGDTYGNYTKYNNPYKISLYLAKGLPVIVWKDAGIAPFIAENHLGYLISSLDDIDVLMSSLSDQDLAERQQHVQKFAPLVRNGYFARHLLLNVEQQILYGEKLHLQAD
ncbi:beta-1,6-galactofuranosyltransferase [Lactobacillus selangorensis]|uniref:Beta-1,6-galactofuranosyltransferase n=1 Tax=Lactobacillus selangorensis TaxID=81857 RepID=A0A0R2FP43_9LACO|nr:beta-1,6-galactofuranosyltransferase [Lactobacillus selangorensis]KRN30335.1 beta-1,6-galactofuranosyltransferase [Lactobacillus selangorensis]